uniref:FAD dependent oxidoreductase domain-containing protein n=3 Tax=Guillardia theta TaxID=55529 RepID=A0A7S4K3F8_GUITH|mmetsp:Transcript_20817/g.69477  ORF Transcript_20817/g.69477 Transcript_20817/m.69477 type:complete len:128 (+) Transcript_20817:188-571(+)
MDVAGSYAGLRPATEFRDYQIKGSEDENWITVAGIRSTGVSASLGIGQYVVSLLKRMRQAPPALKRDRSLQPKNIKALPSPRELISNKLFTHDDCGEMRVIMDGQVRMVSHPLARFGMQRLIKLMKR